MTEPATILLYLFIGALLGATLNFFQFGFSSSFRSLLADRQTQGVRALLWMLGLASLLFFPLLALQSWQGLEFQGFVRPLSLAIPIGALLFGFGMQIGCGCTSGTLNRVGQLQPLSFTTLSFMIIGGTLSAATFDYWQWLPALGPVSLLEPFGWGAGLAIQFAILFILYRLAVRIEHRKHQQVKPLLDLKNRQWHPFLIAGLALAFFNALLLLTTGRPWSIASVFPFWGSQLIDALSLPIDWSFWDYSMQNLSSMQLGILSHPVSLTTIGVILGSLMVSLRHPRNRIPTTTTGLMMSAVGGTIMGFGAVMASGCNIGAFFSGVASGSLHGWLWLVFALIGNYIGLKARQRLLP